MLFFMRFYNIQPYCSATSAELSQDQIDGTVDVKAFDGQGSSCPIWAAN